MTEEIKKSAKRTVTPEKWQEVEQAWTHGKYATLADLSAKFKIPVNQLENRFDSRGLRRGQALEDYNRKMQEELEERAKAEAKIVADRIAETREWHYKTTTGLAKLAWNEVIEAKTAKIPLGNTKNNLSALESAMKVLRMAREERFAVLGVANDGTTADEEEDSLPQMVITELSAQQIEDMRNRQPEDDDEDNDDVVIVGDDRNNVIIDSSTDDDDEADDE